MELNESQKNITGGLPKGTSLGEPKNNFLAISWNFIVEDNDI